MTCVEQHTADDAACQATYQADKAACITSSDYWACIQIARDKRDACEDAAYLRYIQCIAVESKGGGPAASSCGCGE